MLIHNNHVAFEPGIYYFNAGQVIITGSVWEGQSETNDDDDSSGRLPER